jgi:hypothetical protein
VWIMDASMRWNATPVTAFCESLIDDLAASRRPLVSFARPAIKCKGRAWKRSLTARAVAALASPAFAAETMSSLPSDSFTITDYYKQDVYNSGNITTLMVGVGGFLDMGEKDVALPFVAVKAENGRRNQGLTEKRCGLQVRQFDHDLVASR